MLPEFVCAYARMALAHAPRDSTVAHMIAHLSHVAEDTAARGFAGPLAWSQTCIDYVTEGPITWKSASSMQQERTRLSWLHIAEPDTAQRLPCPAYNQERCTHSQHHQAGATTLVHCCGVCFYLFQREHYHQSKTCTKAKQIMGQPDPRHQSRYNNNKQGDGKQGNQKSPPNPKN